MKALLQTTNECVLTVLLVTYNQSNFIEETLYSILKQKTDFPYQILVADDKSTDDTCQKIQTIAKQTTVPIHFIPCDKNVGVLKNYQRGFSHCDTEFVAVMEGDDLWTDDRRLQRHVDCLRSHMECPMSFNQFLAANYDAAQFVISPQIPCPETRSMIHIFARDLASENLIGNFSTCVYRTAALKKVNPDVYNQKAYDWLFHIMLLSQGPAAYIPHVMSVYRVHNRGTWSQQSRGQQLDNILDSIKMYDSYTKGLYHDTFNEHYARIESMKRQEAVIPITHKQKIKLLLQKIYRWTPPLLVKILALFIPPAIADRLGQAVR